MKILFCPQYSVQCFHLEPDQVIVLDSSKHALYIQFQCPSFLCIVISIHPSYFEDCSYFPWISNIYKMTRLDDLYISQIWFGKSVLLGSHYLVDDYLSKILGHLLCHKDMKES